MRGGWRDWKKRAVRGEEEKDHQSRELRERERGRMMDTDHDREREVEKRSEGFEEVVSV